MEKQRRLAESKGKKQIPFGNGKQRNGPWFPWAEEELKRRKHIAGAKARLIRLDLVAGTKVPAYQTPPFSAISEAGGSFWRDQKRIPFGNDRCNAETRRGHSAMDEAACRQPVECARTQSCNLSVAQPIDELLRHPGALAISNQFGG